VSQIKRVLVTGGTGFIGRHAVRLLKEKNYDVVVMSSRVNTSKDHYLSDILNRASVNKMIKDLKPSHLLHLAWNVQDGYLENAQNMGWVIASLNLLNAFAENGGERVVFAGTCFEYDLSYGFLTEDRTPLDYNSFYGCAKANLYRLASHYCKNVGVAFCNGRIFFPFGDGDKEKKLVPSVIKSMRRGEQPALKTPESICDYIYVGDVARALIAILESDVEGAVNIATGKGIRVQDIVRKIADLLGFDLLESQNTTVPYNPPIIADVRRLEREVKLRIPDSLDEGLEKTVRWWVNHI
jgi:nucleoside-diphosphate-sugar epimerase